MIQKPCHRELAAAMAAAYEQISFIQQEARQRRSAGRPAWPVIVLRTPKGWTGPRVVDGVQVEGTWRSHQVPLADVRENPEHLAQLEQWMRSYRPEELFDATGALVDELAGAGTARAPAGWAPTRTPTAACC